MLNTRGVLVVLVLGCLAVGGTLFQTYRFDQSLATLRADEDRLVRQFTTLELTIADARAAQAGYVAVGQGSDFWLARFEELTLQIEGMLRDRDLTGSAAAAPHIAAALKHLDALRTSDQRARHYVENGQRILASDVIFVESLELLGRLSTEMTSAKDTEVFTARQQATTLTQYRMGLTGGALGVLLILAVVAARRRAPAAGPEPVTQPETVTPIAPAPDRAPAPLSALDLDPVGGLDDAADICVDLARLLDGRDLPALLGRAASAIGAKGLVLWIIDDTRETLRPSLAHGYPERMLKRLGTLPVGADNVTSMACRTLQPQVVPAQTFDGSGAIAVPLIGTSGCVGVLAAEVPGASASGRHVAVARIIAAQLAAVITPVAAATTAPSSAKAQ